jgi:uncharacterized protein YbbC (DUF1343 family)
VEPEPLSKWFINLFHPGKFEPTMRLLGSDTVLAELRAGKSVREILETTNASLDQFRKIRAKYLVYE